MTELTNNKINLSFNENGNLVSLTSQDNKIQIPIEETGITAPVEIQLRDEKGEVAVLTPKSKPEIVSRKENSTQILEINWQINGDWGKLDVKGKIALPDDSVLSYWTIEINNYTNQAIFQVIWPRISGLTDYDNTNGPGWLAEPVLMGEKTPDPVHFVNHHEAVIDSWGRHQYGCFDTEGGPADIAYAYPGMWTMQFLAYGHPDTGGLYFAAYDPQALYKCFGLYQDGNTGRHAAMMMKQYPYDRTELGADFKSFYECPIGIYEGDWWGASEIYRKWGLEQFWCKKGPTKDRNDVPEWVKENDIWYWNWQFNSAGHPSQVVPIIKSIKEKFDCEIAFHWYGCNGEVFGGAWRCPEIYPYCPDIRETLTNGVKELHDAGIHCIPYLETRLVNPNIKSFRDADGMKWITINEKGESADEWPTLGHTVCPTAPFFHDLIRNENNRMMKDVDMDGAYLDQVSGCYPVPCFNKDHDHGTGGHDHWVRGYRELMVKVRKDMRELKKDSITTSEGVTECFIDMFDLDLAREIASLDGHIGSQGSLPIPMFHSVYHDYHITYGTVSTFKPRTSSDVIFMDKFYYAEALTLVGGGQLMISGPMAGDDTNEKFHPFFSFMETLCRTRKSARAWFNLGIWKPPVNINCELRQINFSPKLPPKENIPAIINGCYIHDSQLCMVLVNHTEKPQKGSFEINLKEYGLDGKSFEVRQIYPEKKKMKTVDSVKMKHELEIASLSTVLLIIKKNG